MLLLVPLSPILCFILYLALGESRPSRATTSTPSVHVVVGQTLAEHPHDAEAFTQGLEFYGGHLYESTGMWGRSSLRKVNLETGEVIAKYKLEDKVFGEGITIWKKKIYMITWRDHVGYVFNMSFHLQRSFPISTEGWGLCHDGRHLILSDGTNTLYWLSPKDFSIQKRVQVTHLIDGVKHPIRFLNELEYIEDHIYANVYGQRRIAIIHPSTGDVKKWISFDGLSSPNHPEAVLNGIAYNKKTKKFYITGKLWPKLYEARFVHPNETTSLSSETGELEIL